MPSASYNLSWNKSGEESPLSCGLRTKMPLFQASGGKGPQEKQEQKQKTKTRTQARKDSGNNGQLQLEGLVHLHDRMDCREFKICYFKTNISLTQAAGKGFLSPNETKD